MHNSQPTHALSSIWDFLSEHVRWLMYKYSSDARTERDVLQVRLVSQKILNCLEKSTQRKCSVYNFEAI